MYFRQLDTRWHSCHCSLTAFDNICCKWHRSLWKSFKSSRYLICRHLNLNKSDVFSKQSENRVNNNNPDSLKALENEAFNKWCASRTLTSRVCSLAFQKAEWQNQEHVFNGMRSGCCLIHSLKYLNILFSSEAKTRGGGKKNKPHTDKKTAIKKPCSRMCLEHKILSSISRGMLLNRNMLCPHAAYKDVTLPVILWGWLFNLPSRGRALEKQHWANI